MHNMPNARHERIEVLLRTRTIDSLRIGVELLVDRCVLLRTQDVNVWYFLSFYIASGCWEQAQLPIDHGVSLHSEVIIRIIVETIG